MPDPSLQIAIDVLRELEDRAGPVVSTEFGGVYTSAVAPHVESLNFVRVDYINGPIGKIVAAAREAARKYSLRTIVVDVSAGHMTSLSFEGADARGCWERLVRGIYAWDAEPAEPSHKVEQISLDDYLAAQQTFLDASPDYIPAEADGDGAAVRAFADAVTTQWWGARSNGELVCVGELYFVDDCAQLESLSTLPAWEGQGFGTAVTQARVNAAHSEGASVVFAQIEAGNDASVAVHNRVGFRHLGTRNTFILV